MLHRLEERGYIELIVDEFGYERPTHMALSQQGRRLADSIAALEGSDGLSMAGDIG